MNLHSIITALVALCLFALTSGAQSFQINWSTLDGGGGPSSGGSFSLNGTIGQSDAGAMIGGAFTLSGGFWSGLDLGPELLPRLAIRRQGNQVILSWPNPSTGFQLQETSALNSSGTGWANVGPAPSVVGANKEVSLTIGSGSRGFRLRRP